MAQSKFYFDTRSMRKDGTYHLKLMVSHQRTTFLIPLKIFLRPEQWVKNTVTKHPNKNVLNVIVSSGKAELDNFLYDLMREGKDNVDIKQLKSMVCGDEANNKARSLLAPYFRDYCNKCRKAKTSTVYLGCLNKIGNFIGEEKLEKLKFSDITKDWLGKFQKWMLNNGCCLNTCNIHFRSLRAVFNDAIDNDVTSNYPFRKFKMKNVRTRKRSLSVEDLRTLFDYPCEKELVKYRDVFKLMFMLIGINSIDLYNLQKIIMGRIEYTCSKTYRLYSIKVEPEARELIGKYRGETHLLDFADRYRNHEDYIRRLNRGLKSIGAVNVGKHGKKVREPLFPEISSYWARHSWATIAASLDIPKETNAAALGHGGHTVTDIYIDFDQRKVDEANRRVLDWVLYGKRYSFLVFSRK